MLLSFTVIFVSFLLLWSVVFSNVDAVLSLMYKLLLTVRLFFALSFCGTKGICITFGLLSV